MKETIMSENKTNIFLRILYFPLVQIIIAIILVNISTFIVRSITQLSLSFLDVKNDNVTTLIIFCMRLFTVYFAYFYFVKVFEKRKAEEISINSTSIKEIFWGLALGISAICTIIIMWLTGNFTITGINNSATLFKSFLHNFFFAFLQDIVYFAIIFRITERNLGSWIAIFIASIIFGFKHLLFPGYTLWSVIAQSFEAGILFSSLFILSRKIWIIFGFHLAWNFIQYGIILGFEPEKLVPLFISKFSGSSLITGLPVGPEASLLTLCLLTSVGIYFTVKAYKKGYFILPYWKK